MQTLSKHTSIRLHLWSSGEGADFDDKGSSAEFRRAET